MLLSFVIFTLLMKRIYFGPLMVIKHEREGAIDGGRQAAQDAEQKTLSLNQEYEQRLNDARRQAQQVVQEKREAAKGKASEQVSKAREKALAEVEERSAGLKSTRDKVYQSLQPEREALVKTIIEKLSHGQKSVATASPSGVK